MGPAPKPAHLRQRRNKKSTKARLTTPDNPDIPEIPYSLTDLPIEDKAWSPETLAWWNAIWSSPMASEYTEVERYGIGRLAILVEMYRRAPKASLLAEIRIQGACYGLTPLDRARLQWEVVKTEEAELKRRKAKATEKPKDTKPRDPRTILSAVK